MPQGLDDPGLGRPPNIIIGAGVLQPLAELRLGKLDGTTLHRLPSVHGMLAAGNGREASQRRVMMSASISKTLGFLVALVAAVNVAAVASAQGTQTKETVPGGKPIVTTQVVKGEPESGRTAIATRPAKLYNIQAGRSSI
jgi:hypothetical protein